MYHSVIILIIIIIIIIYFSLKYINTDNKYKIYHKKKILSSYECEKLIKLSKIFNLDIDPDPIDDKPEYQIDILTSENTINNIDLWKEIKPIYEKKLIPQLKNISFLNSINYKLDFVFLKRYKLTERSYMTLHTDDNFFTIGILLSNTNDFDGGELYIFDREKSKKYDYIDNLDNEKKDNFIKKYKNLPIIDYNQGDVLIYSGNNHIHGTLPITRGERYVLIFFFDKI